MNPLNISAETVQRFRANVGALVGDPPVALGVGVSGGPDSLALLLLGCAAFPGAVKAATVDHGLRPEAAAEADFVRSVCEALGVEHATLRPAQAIGGNLQSEARRVRYSLLERWRQDHGLDWLATAHHADDQAETVLMRLNRGSGISGLSGVRRVNGRVVRPLLGWRRSELEQIVASAGLKAVEDPSNSDERYDRARFRRDLRDAAWIDPLALARSAEALAEAAEALGWSADRLWEERRRDTPGALTLDVAKLPDELRRRLVRRAIETIAPGRELRGPDLGRFIFALESGGAATLAGVKGESGECWRFSAAPARRGGRPAPADSVPEE